MLLFLSIVLDGCCVEVRIGAVRNLSIGRRLLGSGRRRASKRQGIDPLCTRRVVLQHLVNAGDAARCRRFMHKSTGLITDVIDEKMD